jgi:hypothetical protein
MVSVALGVAVIAEVACKSDEQAACSVDLDCPPGSFCRAGLCAAVTSDGGADAADPGACGTLQNPCPDTDSGVGSSSGSSCQGLYMICSSSECCPGLSCTSGACR